MFSLFMAIISVNKINSEHEFESNRLDLGSTGLEAQLDWILTTPKNNEEYGLLISNRRGWDAKNEG